MITTNDVAKRLIAVFGDAIENGEEINGGDAVDEIVELYRLAKETLEVKAALQIDEICNRLLDSEEHACESAIPPVAEDAVVILQALNAKLGQLEEANQNLVSERDEASGLVSILYAALNDASSVVDRGDDESYAYQAELEAARGYLGIADKPAVTEVPAGDFGRTAEQLEEKHGQDHPDYTREDWRNDVSQGDTKLGYWEWVLHQVESRYFDACDECGEEECDKFYVDDVGFVCGSCKANQCLSEPADADVAEWVGLHYKVNFDAEPADRKANWRQRYVESHNA